VTLAGVMSIPLLIGAGQAFPERDLLIFIAAGVILLSLVSAVIALPILLRGVTKSPDERLHQEVRKPGGALSRRRSMRWKPKK
jgi:CPA1 family monovalent cation:H+ antiporter